MQKYHRPLYNMPSNDDTCVQSMRDCTGHYQKDMMQPNVMMLLIFQDCQPSLALAEQSIYANQKYLLFHNENNLDSKRNNFFSQV